jgi:phthiodiolone/phenolphthiodiolone dimycocerosates ketoreductase
MSQASPSAFSTSAVIWVNRYLPREAIAEQAKQLADSGAVDHLLLFDQMLSWWPQSLWTPKNAPIAAMSPDYESFPDPFTLGGYVAAKAPGLGIMVSTDAVRWGPAELMRSMLTLSDLTEGRATLMLGAGEVKQCKPFGWKRSQGLARFEDHLRLFHEIWNASGPFDFQGNHWVFEQGWLGAARRYRPEIWGLGGGPKLFDLATSFADGIGTVTPGVWSTPEQTAAGVAAIKEQLRGKGRDPEGFGFCPFQMIVMHSDPAVIDRALDNPLIKFAAAVWGRLHMPEWRAEGYEPPFPDDWHYAIRLLPAKMSAADIDDVLGKVTREMVEKAFIVGTPDHVAAELQRHIDAGVTRILPINMLPSILDLEQIPGATQANIDMCKHLKDRAAVPAGAAS